MPSTLWLLYTVLIIVLLDNSEAYCQNETARSKPKFARSRSWAKIPNALLCKSIIDLSAKPFKSFDSGYDSDACRRECEAEPTCLAINHYRNETRCELFERDCKSPLDRHGALTYVLDRAGLLPTQGGYISRGCGGERVLRSLHTIAQIIFFLQDTDLPGLTVF